MQTRTKTQDQDPKLKTTSRLMTPNLNKYLH